MHGNRVLILSFPHSSSMGGGERYTESMVTRLAEKGHDFTLVGSSKALRTVFRKHGWRCHTVFGGFEPVTKAGVILFLLTAPIFMLVQTCVLLWFKFVEKYDTVICLSLTEKLITTTLASALRMKVIWMEHLLPGRAVTENPYRSLLQDHARIAHVVTVSETAKRALVDANYPENRIHVISPGFPVPEKPAGPHADPIIGTVARLHPEKGVMTVLDALPTILRDIPDARLEIYGDGEERGLLEEVVHERRLDDAVRFHGWVDSRKGFYRDFRVLAAPSRKESFGMAVVEAMASGLPVVASRVGGLQETIEDKVTGLLVPPDDADALAEALIRILKDPELARRMGEAGHARARDRYSEERFQHAWDTLLNA